MGNLEENFGEHFNRKGSLREECGGARGVGSASWAIRKGPVGWGMEYREGEMERKPF